MSRKPKVMPIMTLANADQIIKDFLEVQSPRTRKTYECFMRKILEYTKGESGAKMLEDSKRWTQRVFALQQWLLAQGYSPKYVTSCIGCLRGFFTHYRKTLDLNKGERLKLKKTSRNSEDYLFDKVDMQKMAAIGSLKEKYVLLVGASFGLRAEDFAHEFTYGRLRLALQKAEENHLETPIPIGKTKTQKEDIPAYPFINADAYPIVKAIIDSHKEAKDSDLIWNERPSQLTVVLQNLAQKSGIEPHEQRVRFHCLRKYLCDRLSTVTSESKWKQIVGKKISEGEYVSPLELREVYLRAMPSICISLNGEIRAKVQELEKDKELRSMEIEKLQKENEWLRMEIELLKENQKDFDNFKENVNEWLKSRASPVATSEQSSGQ